MVKHRVKISYMRDIESHSQGGAVREASYSIPEDAAQITIECLTSKITDKPFALNAIEDVEKEVNPPLPLPIAIAEES